MTFPIVALQIAPLSTLNIQTDTSFALGLEAQNQGFQLFTYTPDALSYQDGCVLARGKWVTFYDREKDFYSVKEEGVLDLQKAQVVLMRQDPPFNMAYIATTHLLDLLKPPTRVMNNPRGVRNAPEKLSVIQFRDLMPPTLISWDIPFIEEFIHTHDSVVLKPLFEFGGNGIFQLNHRDKNLTSLLEMYRNLYPEPPIIQKFLPEVANGDKRILFIDGKPVGIFKRVPQAGQIRSNMRLGGQAQKCTFTPRDLEICHRIGPFLKEQGLHFVGIDVIGDYLTEINVTSPTGLRVMNKLYNLDLAKAFWESIL